MSHFIQDNQCVVRLADGTYLLFLKGGDNNVYSHANRRLSHWFLQYVFGNIEQYTAFLENAVKGDINGGSWQFASLKNKHFEGYAGYENTVFERFERAFRKSLNLPDWRVKEITIENVCDFENAVVDLLKDNGYSLTDQDGDPQFTIVLPRYSKHEEAKKTAVEKLNTFMDKHVATANGSYRTFCKKWSEVALADALHSPSFCKERGKQRRYEHNDAIDFFTTDKVYEIPLENFVLLMNFDNVEDFIGTYRFAPLLKNYPEHVKYLLDREDGELLKRLDKFRSELTSEGNYRYKHIMENYGMLDSFLSGYETYVAEKNAYEAKRIEEAPKNFIETWNKLIDYCWYKQTDTVLPHHMARLKEFVSLGVKLDEVKEKCDSVREMTSKHSHQLKKNQTAIKKAAKEIFALYLPLLDEKTVLRFCDYFGFENPIKEPPHAKPANVPVERIAFTGTLF